MDVEANVETVYIGLDIAFWLALTEKIIQERDWHMCHLLWAIQKYTLSLSGRGWDKRRKLTTGNFVLRYILTTKLFLNKT